MKFHIWKERVVQLLAGYAPLLWFVCGTSANLQAAATNSVARVWNERALAAIRVDTPNRLATDPQPYARARRRAETILKRWKPSRS